MILFKTEVDGVLIGLFFFADLLDIFSQGGEFYGLNRSTIKVDGFVCA